MAHEDRVAARGVERAVGLDHQLVPRQRLAAVERQRLVDRDLAGRDEPDRIHREIAHQVEDRRMRANCRNRMTISGEKSSPLNGGSARRTGRSSGSLMLHRMLPAGLFMPGPTHDSSTYTN